MADSIRNTVLQLHREGYSIIPSGGGKDGKSPNLGSWKPFQQKQPTKEQISSWLLVKKPPLWGIVTNENVAVFDADTAEARSKLESELGKPHVITPSGGAHWYLDTTGHPLKSSTKPLPGIDVKAVGGFVNLVGRNKQGEYHIERSPLHSELIPYDSLPEWITERIGPSKAPEERPEPASQSDESIPKGVRDDTLTRIGGGARRVGTTFSEILALLREVNRNRCQPPLDDEQVVKIAKSVSRYESENSKPMPLRSIAEVEPKEIEWLWCPYIPRNKLTLLEGDPGEGKSWITLAIAADVSRGKLGVDPADVLIASAEDDLEDTIRPRLEELGADVERIFAIEEIFVLGSKKGSNDEAFGMLKTHISERRPALVVIDPLVAYLGSGVDMHRQNETRPVMARLANLAAQYHCAILLVRHIRKEQGKALYRGIGSIDFTAAVRSVLLAGHAEDDEGNIERAVIHIKCNVAPLGDPLGYVLGPFYWTQTTLTAKDILSEKEREGGAKVDMAKAIITEMLADGEAVSANEIFKAGKEKGISQRTMKTAKKLMKVKSGKKDGAWHWVLPKEGKELPELEPVVQRLGRGRYRVDLDAI